MAHRDGHCDHCAELKDLIRSIYEKEEGLSKKSVEIEVRVNEMNAKVDKVYNAMFVGNGRQPLTIQLALLAKGIEEFQDSLTEVKTQMSETSRAQNQERQADVSSKRILVGTMFTALVALAVGVLSYFKP